jgi:energy-converting hydrogenase A subunit M
VWSVNLHDIFVALLRWEESTGEPIIFGPRNDSQDTWLIHSDSVLERKWDLNALNIPFGKAGCDNAILIEFLRNKFKIVNPAMSLKTIHCHASEIRNYDKTDIVDRPNYMFVEPTGIHELNPISTWSGWAGNPVPYEPLDRPLLATTKKHLNMFCSQMNRDPSFIWSVDGLNTYLPPVGQDRPIDISGGAFVSTSGLVYRHTDIYVGQTDIQKAAWSENRVSHISASYGVNSMMAFHLESEWLQEPALFTLRYLSKVIQQNQKTPNASFWCKKTNGLLAAIHLFKWEKAQGRLLEYNEQTQVFANEVYGRTCHGTRPVKADIEALRKAMDGKWLPSALTKTVAIVQDTYHMNGDLVTRLSESFTSKGFSVRTILFNADATTWAQGLSGCSHVILSSSVKHIKHPSWAWLWLAPSNCKVLELQEEREPSDSLIHLCAAASQEWTLLQYPRSTPEGFKKIVEKEVEKWLPTPVEVSTLPVLPSVTLVDVIPVILKTIPLVLTPPKDMKHGFFGHKGDSFRELIDLWEEAGFIERKEDPSLTMCWLNKVGDTLLYDRPTWTWLEKASEAEQAYNSCLTGNPNPSEKPNAKPWIFWPREPRLVEELATNLKTYTERTESMVFYGRIENQVQATWRQDISGWSEACSKFSLQNGKEPYLLNSREYLEALQNSKYGLCLRGYGPKCNREIELLAMGCIPIVTSDVDIVNYMEPLMDGIHVLRVSGPEDALKKISMISETQWASMSKAGHQWWEHNCSIQGSWQRTSALLL